VALSVLGLVTGALLLAAPGWRYTAEVGSDVPLDLGVAVRAESPERLRGGLTLGYLPGGYVALINDTVGSLGGYDASTAEVIEKALERSLVVRLHGGWRPWAGRGFYFGGGASLIALGGAATGQEILSAASGQPVEAPRAASTDYDLSTHVLLADVEVGWDFELAPHWTLRAALGGSFTLDAGSEITLRDGSPNRLQAAFSDAAEVWLEETLETYVHTPLVTLAGGYRW